MPPLQLIARTRTILLLLWPVTVHAAAMTFGEAMEQVTGFEWVAVAVLSTLAGATALLIKISGMANEDPPVSVHNMPLLIGAHMCGSWLAGLMTFFAAKHLEWGPMLVALSIPAVAFGGARGCEFFYNLIIAGKLRVRLEDTK
ncbi:hypothetical protein GCM10023144_01160 [Pigmentiphaga soli]|uniref:Uncharacterized protein n=1 Tax=Pigmentiphaga soli TaxID=1007095 RepID=A0ABP8GD26_9BURK